MAVPTQSYILDGDSDYVSLADHGDLDADTSFSFGLWVRLDYDAVTTANVYLYDRESAHSIWLDTARRVNFLIYGAGTLVSDGSIPVEKPTFIVCTATESGTSLILSIYFDGALEKTVTLTTATMPAAVAKSTFICAYRTPANYMKGTVSSVFMTDDLVTPAEVLACFNDADGDHTGNIGDLGISIITATETDVANANGSAGAGTAQGTAAARTYMDLFQSGNPLYVPEVETRYNYQGRIAIRHIKWYGDTITAAGEECSITRWNDVPFWHGVSEGADLGQEADFGDDGIILQGFKIATLEKGMLLIYLK